MVEKSENREGDDEISIDFSKIKGWFKGFGKKSKSKKSHVVKDDDEISVDWKKVGSFFSKNKIWLLLLIPIMLSIFFRIQPVYLPITDDWAENSVNNYYRSQVLNQINQQYPNLPDENKNVLVEAQLEEIMKQNKDTVKQQTEQLSQQYKDGLQDENGDTYLLAIDPYFWYAHAMNYIDHGQLGDEIVDGKESFSLRNGRFPKDVVNIPFNSYVGAFAYKFFSIFNKNISLMRVMFFIPLVIITLSVIPAFFIARKIGGDIAGLFAGTIVAINAALLGRTPAGFADTDGFNILFPLMIIWMVFLSLESKDNVKRIVFGAIGALFVGLYSITWGGWWYVFDFILATLGIYLVYLFVIDYKRNIKKVMMPIKNLLITITTLLLGSMIFITIFSDFSNFISFFNGPLAVITLKDVAVTTVWPNVMTTVAEFNEVQLSAILSQMGGSILFLIAIIGIVWVFLKKDNLGNRNVVYGIFLTIWFIGTAYGFTKGIRFSILMVPGFAIAFGICCGYIYELVSKWLSKELNLNKTVSIVIVVLILCLLFISPLNAAANVAKNEIPSMDDGWYNNLKAIGEESEDAIITSWWDFGHWFYATSERRVTFDGADQGERIHWVGKSLTESNETLAVGILRMLNCGQEKPPHVLECYLSGGSVSDGLSCDVEVDRMDKVKAVNILNNIVVMDKNDAEELLKEEGLSDKQIDSVIELTHCDDLIDNYYITSADMIRKSGVWAHFGSWDFEKAAMYQSVVKTNYDEGIKILKEKFELSDDEADTIYYEIKNNDADQWVSPWPSYASDLVNCNTEEGIITCASGLKFDLKTKEAWADTPQGKKYPKSFVWAELDGLHKKEYTENVLNAQNGRGLSAALIPAGNGNYQSLLMDEALADSTFTRLYYFKGHGSKHFELFKHDRGITGVDIYTWKINWEEKDPIIMEELLEQPQIRASHILVNTSEEAEEIIALLKNNSDFGELAKERSIGPSGVTEGELGWFTRGMMVPEFEQAAFALEKVGDISGAVKTQFGYHIIKLTGKKSALEVTKEKQEMMKELEEENEEVIIEDEIVEETEEVIEDNKELVENKTNETE